MSKLLDSKVLTKSDIKLLEGEGWLTSRMLNILLERVDLTLETTKVSVESFCDDPLVVNEIFKQEVVFTGIKYVVQRYSYGLYKEGQPAFFSDVSEALFDCYTKNNNNDGYTYRVEVIWSAE
ncbi:MAG: hypothetical protein KBT03_00175 [Bacteroidales bacterium]|nr:hypothetical protein [Candidatus Scybalousia scybalohippi]